MLCEHVASLHLCHEIWQKANCAGLASFAFCREAGNFCTMQCMARHKHRVHITYFARTNFRNTAKTFGIRRADRLHHMYIIGKTGTGKSTLLETLIHQDIANGEGCVLLDPHGDLVERVAAHAPTHRAGDIIYFNVPDPQQPYTYNPLGEVPPEKRPLAVSGLLEVFHKLWGEKAWGQRMEHILRNALYAVLEHPGATLPDVLHLLRDKNFRNEVVRDISNEQVKQFWTKEFPQYSPRYKNEAIAPVESKIGSFLSDPKLYRILTGEGRALNLRRIMDEQKVLLVNLSMGRLGEDTASLLGALLVTSIGLAGFSRADTDKRPHFWVYLDEFQSFSTLALVEQWSELRKFNIGIVASNQYLHQIDPAVKHAVLGNAGTLVSFRVGPEDAAFLAKEFEPKFGVHDMLNLPNYNVYLKLMVDGTPSKPFSATTLHPFWGRYLST